MFCCQRKEENAHQNSNCRKKLDLSFLYSSLAHKWAPNGINFDDIHWEKSYDKTVAYGASKLANIYHAKVLAQKLENTGISVYVLHPGVINTELMRHSTKAIPKFLHWMIAPVAWVIKTPFHGAQTTLYCTLEDKIEGESGYYYSDCARAPTLTRHAEDKEAAQKLWDMSEELTGLKK